jgi:hypothetical protein
VDHLNSLPPTSTTSSRKLEKDILKHASRIRINNSSNRRQSSSKSHTSADKSTRMNHPNKENRTIKSSNFISLVSVNNRINNENN